jgi:outer membrane protein TolC
MSVRAATVLVVLLAAGAARGQVPMPAPAPTDRGLPINLATAFELARVRNLDVQVAAERVAAAAARLDLAYSRWLPNVYLGGDYARQEGRIQDVTGNIFNTTKQSAMVGAGPSFVFSPSEAILGPLAARQVVAAREADRRAAENDITLSVAEAYFNVQQARGELAGAIATERLAADLADRAEKLAAGLAQPVEVHRARTELARRQQAVETARERWETASAELNRLIRLPPTAVLVPAEPADLRIELFGPAAGIDELIPIGLRNRPELAANQALVEATLARLREEKLRPLVPSLIVRGNATNPAGTLSTGAFGGGLDSQLQKFGTRNSYDVQVLWELQGLGFGNRAAVREREAENRGAVLELLRTQDRVAADVVDAQSRAARSAARVKPAAEGVAEAAQTVKTHLAAINQTRRVGDALVLIFRPQEAVAAVQALDQAYRDYYAAVGDANRAQFRLYRALGHPAACVLDHAAAPPARLAVPAGESGSGFAVDR